MKFRVRRANDRFLVEVNKEEPTFGDLFCSISNQCGAVRPFQLSLNGRDIVAFTDDNELASGHGLRNGDLLYVLEQPNAVSLSSSVSSSVSVKMSTDNAVPSTSRVIGQEAILRASTSNNGLDNTSDRLPASEDVNSAVLGLMRLHTPSNSLLSRIEARLSKTKGTVDVLRLVSELIVIALHEHRCQFVLQDECVVSKSTIKLLFQAEPSLPTGDCGSSWRPNSRIDAAASDYESEACKVQLTMTKMCNDSVVCFARSESTSKPVNISCTIASAQLGTALREFSSVAASQASSKQVQQDVSSRLSAKLSQVSLMLSSLLFSRLFDALSELIGAPRRLQQLDGYVLQSICEYLDCTSLLRCGETCRRLRDVATDNQVWYRLYLRDFCRSLATSDRPSYSKSPGVDWRVQYRNAYAVRKQRERQQLVMESLTRPGYAPLGMHPRDPFSPFAPLAPSYLPTSPFLDADPFGPPLGPVRLGSAGALAPIRPRRFYDGGSFL